MSVVLIGYRGSGKSTIGRKLAARLWWKFVDTDDSIVAAAGKSIREIFEQDGEPHFRALETQAVEAALKLKDHVIALGGGAVLAEANRQMIAASGAKVIYLKCDAAVLAERIAADPQTAANRPSLTGVGGAVEEVARVLAEREPLYRQACHAELDVTHLTPDDAVVYLARLL